jgi:CelD/BcsL family acetyltransferase involved in cellulose biosynthesis
LKRGWLQLNFLVVNDTPVATYLNFDYNDHILVYNSGLDPAEYGHLSPGIVLLAYTIEHAIELKRDVFDFLRGDEQYKYRMGGTDTSVMNLRAVWAD